MRIFILFLMIAALGGTANACGGGAIQIDFSSPEQPTPTASSSEAAPGVIRLAIASVISPLPTSDLYENLANYLGSKLGRKVELVQGKTYAETNDLVKSGDVTLALVCTNPYLQGREDFGMELLAAPVVNGATVYYSLLIAGNRSQAQSLKDLRGATFAFSDPLSNSGRLAPLYQLALLGESPDAFFSRTIFTYAHDSSIRAVAEGVVDAAAVDSLVFENLKSTDPDDVGRVRVIERWGPFGINPFVVNPGLDPSLKAQLRSVLLGMHEDQDGAAILARIGIERFVVPDDSIYDSVREMRAFLRARGLGP
jgi:phosphonate transport system substrate-binding protein